MDDRTRCDVLTAVMFAAPHPLDVDIADLADGTLDTASAEAVEAHVDQCLLCRIKRQRFAGQPPVDLTQPSDVVVPDFVRLTTEREPGQHPVVGDLWTTAGPDSLIVLVRSVEAGEAIVVPVVVDIEVADDECEIVSARLSPLGIPIAIYSQLRIDVPVCALYQRIVPIRDIDLLRVADVDGVVRGSAIEGPGDPRLEIRQYLTDCLTGLTRHEPETSSATSNTPVSPSELFRRVVETLADCRRFACVEAFAHLRIPDAAERRWVGIARVDELGVVVLAIDTPFGLNDRSDFLAAHALLTRCGGSALAITTSGISGFCDVFDASGLFGATQVPDGGKLHQPAISEMPLPDAIAKYLDVKLTIPLGTGPTVRGSHVEVGDVLARQVGAAVSSMVITGSKARIEAKKKGYMLVGESTGVITDVLREALSGVVDTDCIARLSDEVES